MSLFRDTIAEMPTCVDLVARLLDKSLALRTATHVLESYFLRCRHFILRNLNLAESAFSRILFVIKLFACEASVIGLLLALAAEIESADASDSVLGHMDCGLSCH